VRAAALVRSVGVLGVTLVLPAFWFESRTLALIAVGALTVEIAADVVAGIAHYREVMAREWPKVEPLDNEEDW
jgi:hypothetical protein